MHPCPRTRGFKESFPRFQGQAGAGEEGEIVPLGYSVRYRLRYQSVGTVSGSWLARAPHHRDGSNFALYHATCKNGVLARISVRLRGVGNDKKVSLTPGFSFALGRGNSALFRLAVLAGRAAEEFAEQLPDLRSLKARGRNRMEATGLGTDLVRGH